MKMLGSDAQRKGSASASSTVDESAIQEGEPSASPTQRRATDTENISPTPSSSDTNTVTNEAQDRHSQSSVDTDTEIPSRHAALAHLTNRTRERLRSMANREQSSSSFNAALTHRRRSSAGEPIVERETDSEDLPSQPPSEPQETSPALVELSTPPESSDIASAPAEPSTPPENSITAFVIAESSTSPESSITASAPVEPSTSPENSSNTASPPVEPSIAPESNNTASTLAGTSTSLESSNIASVPADPPTYDESVNAASAPQSRDTSRRTTPFHSSQPSESTPPTTAGPSRRQSLSHDRLEDLRSALVNTQPPPVTPPVTNEDLEQREVRSTPPQNPLDIFENLPPPLDVQASIDEVLAQNRVETQHFAPQQVAAGTQAPPGEYLELASLNSEVSPPPPFDEVLQEPRPPRWMDVQGNTHVRGEDSETHALAIRAARDRALRAQRDVERAQAPADDTAVCSCRPFGRACRWCGRNIKDTFRCEVM